MPSTLSPGWMRAVVRQRSSPGRQNAAGRWRSCCRTVRMRGRAQGLPTMSTFSQPAVIALARVAFGVLVREHRAHRFHDGRRGDVFGGDQLDSAALTRQLFGDGGSHRRVGFRNVLQRQDCSFLRTCRLVLSERRVSSGESYQQERPLRTPVTAKVAFAPRWPTVHFGA